MCRRFARGVMALTIVWCVAESGFAQLSPEQLDALRERGEKEGWSFTVGENPATRMPIEQLCGLVPPENWWEDAPFDPCRPERGLPEAFDWRDYGGCTPIKSQGSCGSCWAFATVGALECNILIVDGEEVDLSEQWLVSECVPAGDCGGGWFAHSYHGGRTDPCDGTGAVLERYFPYTASNAPCDCPYPHEYLIDRWSHVGFGGHGVPSVDNIKQAILDYGPVSVAVYVGSAFQGYNGGVFDACPGGTVNHAVVLVGWDDNQGDEGVWILRNSWGPGWGEDGYMRIQYRCSSVGYAACYVDYSYHGPPLIAFEYPDGVPETVMPLYPARVRVNVVPANGGEPVPGTGVFYYRIEDGEWHVTSMNELEPNEYEVTLPALDCGYMVQYYFSAVAVGGYIFTDPLTHYSTVAAFDTIPVLDDAFETDLGWTVGAPDDDASTGVWGRMDPEGTEAQPEDDCTPDPGTICYVTDGRAGGSTGDYDVDDGKTTLLSPLFDLSQVGGTKISYWRWYSNMEGSNPFSDVFVVDISNDGGDSWTNVETVGPEGSDVSGGWYYHDFRVADFVTPTEAVQVRFVASDEGDGSIVEAAVDDFVATAYECEPQCVGDLNFDDRTDQADLGILLGAYGSGPGGDLDGDYDTDQADLGILLADWNCGVEP